VKFKYHFSSEGIKVPWKNGEIHMVSLEHLIPLFKKLSKTTIVILKEPE
jgi:hypothetical protein